MEIFGYVFATKALVEQKRPVMYMYKEKVSGGDSGWRFFAGFEDQSYLNNPNNIGIYSIETILAVDPSIEPYLGSLCNRAYERDSKDAPFRRIDELVFGKGD